MVRKGMGKGTGKGYKNMIGIDKKIHSMSAKGIKQPQKVNPIINKAIAIQSHSELRRLTEDDNDRKELQEKYKSIPIDEKKAMERLIFLVRANKDEKTIEGKESIRIGFEEVAKELDRLKVPFWKQNYISMLAEENNWYMDKIIKKIYFLKKPTDFKRESTLQEEPSLDKTIRLKFKNYDNQRLVDKANRDFKSDRNTDDVDFEIARRKKLGLINTKMGFDTIELIE